VCCVIMVRSWGARLLASDYKQTVRKRKVRSRKAEITSETEIVTATRMTSVEWTLNEKDGTRLSFGPKGGLEEREDSP